MEIVRFVFPFGVALALALLLSDWTIRLGRRHGLYADPRKIRYFRKHAVALGGLPLAGAFFAVALYALLSVPAGGDEIYGRVRMVRLLWGLFFGAFLLVGGGLYCLRTPRRSWLMGPLLLAAVALAYFFRMRIEAVGLFDSRVILLHGWSFPVTLLWFVLVVAIFEILDSVDGLANIGLTVGSLLGFALVKFSAEVYVPFLYSALAGAGLGCLWTNNFRPRMVHGPTGSKLIGFLFAGVTLIARQKETVVQVVVFPVALVVLVVVFSALTYLDSRRSLSEPAGSTPEAGEK